MKLIKSIFLLASLFLIVSCGRARKPVNEENNNNEITSDENENILSPETSELIRKLANGYTAELTIENISGEHELDHINMFFGNDICGRENYNLYKGEGGYVYCKTLDFKNKIVSENLSLTGKPNEYDYLYSNGFKLLSGYKLVDGSFEITDTSIAKAIFYNTFIMSYDEYCDNLIINKMVLKDNENQNPSLEIYYDLKAGTVINSYFCYVDYISYDYSPYILESLPTLPEHEEIGNALDEMRLLNNYTIKLLGSELIYYVTESSILIENYYDYHRSSLVSYLYETVEDNVFCYEIMNDAVVSTKSTKLKIKDIKSSFAFAKEVFVKESTHFYIFNNKVIPKERLIPLNELLPTSDIDDFTLFCMIENLRFNTGYSNRFDIYYDSSLFLTYYDFNSTIIPSKYNDILEVSN